MLEKLRFNMIEQQVRTWDVLDENVLDLLKTSKREDYVPKQFQKLAFADIEIPLSHGEKMLSPKIEGRILQSLEIKPHDHVYHVGTGSGYFVLLLASLANDVLTVDIHLDFIEAAKALHRSQKLSNIHYIHGNGFILSSEFKSFDVIVFTGSCKFEPLGFRERLNLNGRMFYIENHGSIMKAKLIKRISEDQFSINELFDCAIPHLSYERKEPDFAF